MTGIGALVIRSTGGPVAAGDIDQRVREWCEALGLTPGGDDNNTEENPE
jgi:hypothetical protein